MKGFVFSLLACVCLIAATAWLVVTPAYAATATVTCGDGSTLTCSGTGCVGSDSSNGNAGYCSCSKSDGTNDSKTCRDQPLLD